MELQTEALISSKLSENLKTEKRSRYAASNIQLLCRNCFKSVASGSDIQLVDNAHYVNVNTGFE